MSKINIAEKFANITEYYKPRIAAELNGQHVKLVKVNREFVFHHHDNEHEMFLVVKGRLRMDFSDHHEWIETCAFIEVPLAPDHRPAPDHEPPFLLSPP